MFKFLSALLLVFCMGVYAEEPANPANVSSSSKELAEEPVEKTKKDVLFCKLQNTNLATPSLKACLDNAYADNEDIESGLECFNVYLSFLQASFKECDKDITQKSE